jgi:acyl-coenzyme A synthetase/AMP-(fatty) acid ligase
MRVIRETNPEGALKSPADEWQAPPLNYTSGTSGRAKGVIYRHRGAYLMAMETVAGRALPPTQTVLSEMATHRATETQVIALCGNKIAHFNAPITRAVRALRKTATGKIPKFILQAIAREMGPKP